MITSAMQRPALSVVTTLYKSEPYIEEFYRRVTETIAKLNISSYEVIFVNDASPDGSHDMVMRLVEADPHVVVVDLSRNFGHHKALLAGIGLARGERVFLVDSDLEEEPEILVAMMEELERRHCDVVYAMQETRRGGWFERTSGHLYYWATNAFSGIDFPRNLLTSRLMTHRYVESLLSFREREVLLNGISHLAGYEQVVIPAVKHRRNVSTYSIRQRVNLALLSVISFSDRPLKWIFYMGLSITLLAFMYIMFIVVRFLSFGIGVSGFTSIIISIWLLGGLNVLFLGTIGIYVAVIFSETKQRPNAIVRAVYRNDRGRVYLMPTRIPL